MTDVVTVVITRADGGVTVKRIIKTPNLDITPEFIEAEIAKRAVFDGHLGWEIVPNEYCDEDRTYRNAWKHVRGGRKPDHDMVKARDIHRGFLRRKRLAEMDALDIEYQRADEDNDQAKKKAVAARKQKLRDVTADPRIEAAQTVDELKTLTIEVLA